jgi:hypothetical protein
MMWVIGGALMGLVLASVVLEIHIQRIVRRDRERRRQQAAQRANAQGCALCDGKKA